MKLIPKTDSDGRILGWNSDDEVGLYWYASAGSGDPLQPPATLTAFKIGMSGIERGEARDVEIESLNYIGAGLFGPARPSLGGTSKWTGNSYRFGIYTYNGRSRFHDEAVIIRQDGGGIYTYILEDIDAASTWRRLCALLDQPTLWDLCSSLAHTYEKGIKDGRTAMGRLFLSGRLRKRTKRGTEYLEITHEQFPRSKSLRREVRI